MATEPLNRNQQHLVRDHLHLVSRYLNHHVPNLRKPRHDREEDDLYQEGCLGLMRAAKCYNPACNIPFEAFAHMRIRRAVSLALYEKFSTVRIPMKTQVNERKLDISERCILPKVQSIDVDPDSSGRHFKTDPSGSATIGDRIRDKYDAAVELAERQAKQTPGRRGDRAELVDCIIKKRLTIPDDQEKTSLRQIARETRSSYSRVAICEKKLITQIHKTLKGDLEYRQLMHRASHSLKGLNEPITDSIDEFLMMKFKGLMSRMAPAELGKLLWRLLVMTGGDPRLLLFRLFTKLTREDQQSTCAQLDKLPRLEGETLK